MNIKQEREAFEAEIRENWGFAKLERVGGDYIDPETQGLWGLWNARAALQSRDREDAERYRWLRENWFTMGSTYKDDQIQFYINGPRYSNATEADLDAAIDHGRRIKGEGE